ncbi:MAG: hypothetical protein ACQESK_06970 [Bacteroidota bacterium]
MACNSNDQNQSQDETENQSERQQLKELPLSNSATAIGLSEEAKEATENWMHYTSMQSEVERMQDYAVADVMSNASTIKKVADTLQRTIPKKFQNKPIESRLKVLYTKASLLNQLSNQQSPDLMEIKKVAEEIPIDFYNLNIQLNEVFIETPTFD